MLELYYGVSGNSLRALIALEECGIEFSRHPIDLDRGEQGASDFLQINPMGNVPVIVDSSGSLPRVLAQSGAIMLYAAEKSGMFIPDDPVKRLGALQWFFAACSDVGPANAIIKYFSTQAPDPTEANIRYLEGRLYKLLRVFSDQIADKSYILPELTIADLALYPFVHIRRDAVRHHPEMRNLSRWYDLLSARPPIQRALGRVDGFNQHQPARKTDDG